jgi:hypothetical protein
MAEPLETKARDEWKAAIGNSKARFMLNQPGKSFETYDGARYDFTPSGQIVRRDKDDRTPKERKRSRRLARAHP